MGGTKRGAADDDDGVGKVWRRALPRSSMAANSPRARPLLPGPYLITLQAAKPATGAQTAASEASVIIPAFLAPEGNLIRHINHMYTFRHTRTGTLVTDVHPIGSTLRLR